MKIKGLPGEFYFRAFYKGELTFRYFRSFLEAQSAYDETIIWPVEIMDGTAYVPSQEELENED